MHKKLLFCMLMNFVLQAEFMMYKVDLHNDKNFLPLNYGAMSTSDQKYIQELYQNSIYRYQFPTVKLFYHTFSKQEKIDYDNALKKPYGLFLLTKSRLELLSDNQYSVIWIPTTIFEISALYIYFAAIQSEKKKLPINDFPLMDQTFIKLAESLLAESVYSLKSYQVETDFSMRDPFYHLYFVSCDYVLRTFKNQTISFDYQDSRIIDQWLLYIKQIGSQLRQHSKQDSRSAGFNSVYVSDCLSVIQRYLGYEQEALKNNQFILVRGTNGQSLEGWDMVDYRLGKTVLNGISYGYSLFAGTVFDRKIFPSPARAIDYIVTFKIGYVLLIDIADVFKVKFFMIEDILGKQLFVLSPLTSVLGLFGKGEFFHPHIFGDVISKLSVFEQEQSIQDWARYLSKAKIIKNNSLGLDILEQEKQFQLEEMINWGLQGRSKIESESNAELHILEQNMARDLEQLFLRGKVAISQLDVSLLPYFDVLTVRRMIPNIDELNKDQVRALSVQISQLSQSERKLFADRR